MANEQQNQEGAQMKFRNFLSNFGWFTMGEFATVDEAKADGIRGGYEFSVHAWNEGTRQWEIVGGWSTFGGWRTY